MVDLAVAERFLCWLAGGPGHRFQFRAIPERAGTGGRAINFLATFARDGPELARLNEAGYAIFAAVNETTGTRDKHVTGVRCAFLDFDKIPEDQRALRCFDKAAPHSMAVMSSPGRFHFYWHVHDFPLGQFRPLQQRLALGFGADPTVSNPSRVMRIAGSWHWKGEPFRSRIIRTATRTPYSFTCDQLEQAFAQIPKGGLLSSAPTAQTAMNFARLSVTDEEVDRILGKIATAPPGKRNHTLFANACRLREQRTVPWQYARELLTEAARLAGLDVAEIRNTLNSVSRRIPA